MRILPFLLLLLFSCRHNIPANLTASEARKAENRATLAADSSALLPDTATVAELPPPATDTLPPIDYDTTQWTEVIRLDSTIRLDIRYATDNNFVGEKMYDCARCLLRPQVARAVVAAHRELREQGYGLKMYDCYRPRPYQWRLWNKVPDARYVADPRRGSAHNRGAAVDLTVVDSLGNELDMGTPYDFFGEKAYPAYTNLPDSVLANRRLLARVMQRHNFLPIRTEWWHFNYNGRRPEISDDTWGCE